MCVYCQGNALEGLDSDYFPTHSLRLSPTALVSNSFSQHLRDSLEWGDGETVNYYIETQSSYGQGWYGDQWYLEDGTWFQSVGQGSEDIEFITNVFAKLDPLIDLDFNRKYTHDGTNFDIYSVDWVSTWEIYGGGIVGQVFPQFSGGAWWDIFWKDTDGSFSLNDFDKNSIIHEIGHALGLSHPNEDPTNPNWNTDDTVMSYNQSPDGWDYWFTETDIAALQLIWGREVDGSNSNDTLTGDSGANTISALYGDDTIDSGAGNDIVYGNQGADRITAGTGADYLYGGQGGDTLYGNQGADKLYGNFQDDVLYGGKDNDWQHGGKGADQLYGNFGIDEMYGGRDNDWLHGGRENDKLWGNHGADKFCLSKGQDQVMDFNASEGDLISLPAGTAYTLVQQGTNLLIDAALGDLLLVNISINSFNPATSIVFG